MKYPTVVIVLCTLVLAACGGAGASNPPLPTVVLSGATQQPAVDHAGVTASGIVLAVQEARLSFLTIGKVTAVHVQLGDTVEAGQVLVELDDAAARRDLAQAESALTEFTSPTAIARARQDVAATEEAQQTARNRLEYYITPGVLYWEERLALSEQTLDAAKAGAGTSPTSEQTQAITEAEKAVSRAQANLAYAQKQLHDVYLPEKFTRINSVTGESYVAEPRIDTDASRADYAFASAALDEARAYLAVLTGEPAPSNVVGRSLAQLELAQRNLTAARAALEATRLLAPFAGTIALVSAVPGENAVPGAIVVSVIDLSRLHVETTDLSERDVTQVSVGQSVRVHIDALGEEVSGRVSAIAPGATTLGGDVVYKTIIDLDVQPPGIRAGMSAEVTFEASN